jgi:hypothetical protein
MCLVSLVDNSLIGKLSVILIRANATFFFIVLCSTSFSFNPKVGTAFRKECGTVFMQPVVVHFVHKGGKYNNGNPLGNFQYANAKLAKINNFAWKMITKQLFGSLSRDSSVKWFFGLIQSMLCRK